jgi:Sap, sulfolipid-1-addressing protein
VGWVEAEFALVCLAAMFSPTTLTFSVLALVLAERPLRTGVWFYAGAVTATLGIGVVAAFVLGDTAAPSSGGGQKTWVSVFDLAAAAALVVYVARTWRKPISDRTREGMVTKMSALASSPWLAVFAAGATLANPGGFIPLALKEISQLDPSTAGYVAEWIVFTLVSVLPLSVALVLLLVSRDWAERLLHSARAWLESRLRLIASAIILLLAISLLRNGISGLS